MEIEWSSWKSLGKPQETEIGRPFAQRNQDGRLEVFAIGAGARINISQEFPNAGSRDIWLSKAGKHAETSSRRPPAYADYEPAHAEPAKLERWTTRLNADVGGTARTRAGRGLWRCSEFGCRCQSLGVRTTRLSCRLSPQLPSLSEAGLRAIQHEIAIALSVRARKGD